MIDTRPHSPAPSVCTILCNAIRLQLRTFQRLMKEVVRDMENSTQAYLDDLVVFSDTWIDAPFPDNAGKITKVWFSSKNGLVSMGNG